MYTICRDWDRDREGGVGGDSRSSSWGSGLYVSELGQWFVRETYSSKSTGGGRGSLSFSHTHTHTLVCAYVCVCVREKESKKKGERE